MLNCQLPSSLPGEGSGSSEGGGMSASSAFWLVVGIFAGWVSMGLIIALTQVSQ